MEVHPIIDPYVIHYDTFADDVYTLDTASITLTAGTLTAAAGIFTGVVQAPDFAKTGWPVTPGVTLSFAYPTFTVTNDNGAYYYIDGVKYALGATETVDITDTEGKWYIYFVGDTLTASQVLWSFTDEDKALVAILYWSDSGADNEAISEGYELHNFHMSGATHSRLHYGGGAAWSSGLLVSDNLDETVDVETGAFYDEDIKVTVTDGAGAGLFEQVLTPAELPIFYRNAASDWRKFNKTDKANNTDVGYVLHIPDVSDDLKYNELSGTWTTTTVGLNNYVAYFVVATPDLTEPVALIMGQRVDNKLVEAKANNIFSGLSLTGLPFEELIVIARIILKDTGAGVFYDIEDVQDLRAFNAEGNVTSPLITSHAGLSQLAWSVSGHYFDAAVDFNSQNLTSIGTIGCGTITLTANSDVVASGTGHITSGSEGFIVGTLTITDGSIDDTDGSIAFGATNFTGVGAIGCGAITSTSTITATDLVANDDVTVGESIVHQGDVDTYIGFAADYITLYAGGELLFNVLNEKVPRVGFFGNTQAQQNHIVDADGNLADITTKFNVLLADLEGYGLLLNA